MPGWLAARRWLPGGSPAEAAGLGLLLSLSVGLNLLFVAHLCGLPLTAPAALGFLALLTVAATAVLRRAYAPAVPPTPVSSTNDSAWTPAELLLAGLVVLLVVLSAVKGGFYPIVAADAHAYDGRARWIVIEKTLNLSIYRDLGATGATNLSYPPLFPLSLALGYWVGAPQGRVIDTFYFAAAALLIYGFLRRRVPRLGALIGALLLVTTPEIWNHASLALLNLPAMAFFGGALLAALWLVEAPARPPAADRSGWLLAGLLNAGAAGVRSDAALLILATLPAFALLLARRRLDLRAIALRLALLAGPALIVTALWQFYLKSHFGFTNSEPFRPGLIADAATIALVVDNFFRILSFGKIYGLIGWLSLAGLLLTLAWRPRPMAPYRHHLGLAALLALTLIALYQALDPAFGGGLKELLPTSFKRGIFYLIPLLIAALLLAPPIRWALERFDAWQRSA